MLYCCIDQECGLGDVVPATRAKKAETPYGLATFKWTPRYCPVIVILLLLFVYLLVFFVLFFSSRPWYLVPKGRGIIKNGGVVARCILNGCQ